MLCTHDDFMVMNLRGPDDFFYTTALYATIEHHLTNLLFSLFFSFFSPFVHYCLMPTVSSTPSKSHENLSFFCPPSQVIDMIGHTFVHIFKGLRDR